MRETWLKLTDGRVVHPDDCAPDDDGVLMHKSGTAVAMRGAVPSSYGVDLTDEITEAREFVSADREAGAAEGLKPSRGKRGKGRDLKPQEPAAGEGYLTRSDESEG